MLLVSIVSTVLDVKGLRQTPNVPKNHFNTHVFVAVHLILSCLIRWSLHPCLASLVSFHLFTGYWSKECIARPRSKFHAQGHLQSEGPLPYTTTWNRGGIYYRLLFLTRFGSDMRGLFSLIFLKAVDLLCFSWEFFLSHDVSLLNEIWKCITTDHVLSFLRIPGTEEIKREAWNASCRIGKNKSW